MQWAWVRSPVGELDPKCCQLKVSVLQVKNTTPETRGSQINKRKCLKKSVVREDRGGSDLFCGREEMGKAGGRERVATVWKRRQETDFEGP